MKKINVVFFGTPDFSVPTLDSLLNHPSVNIKYVISMPDRKSGRGQNEKSPEVISFSKEKKIPFFQTDNINKEDDFISQLEMQDIDCFIVLAFAQFLGERVLNIPKSGCFNIHTSLLPKYRGAAPIQYALLNGDVSTGVSIQKMVKKMDAGDLCWSDSVNISNNETGGQLYTRLKFQAALSANNFINAFIAKELKFEAQDESLVSFAPTLKREDGFLDFKNEKSQNILNKINALYPWPGTYCFLGAKRLKVFYAKLSSKKIECGEINTQYNEIHIGCLDHAIQLCEIQLEGKKRCSVIELFNGLRSDITINKEV